MKRNTLIIITALVALVLCAPAALAQPKEKDKLKDKSFETGERMERAVAADPNVVVTLCLASGDIMVRGWDKSEVKVVAASARQLDLQGGGQTPPKRLDIAISNAPVPPGGGGAPFPGQCNGTTNVEINVPRGATVDIRVRSGDVEISDVTEARVNDTSGDITISGVKRAVEADAISGDITLTSSSGRVRLRSISGDVDATDIRMVEAGDEFEARSTGGDITLEGVAQARVSANTTSGMVTMTGPLVERGNYDLKSFSGDVVLNLPSGSSFRLDARALRGEIVTEFQIKSTSDADSRNLLEGRGLTGTVGSGDASLTLHTFSGTVRLQKRD